MEKSAGTDNLKTRSPSVQTTSSVGTEVWKVVIGITIRPNFKSIPAKLHASYRGSLFLCVLNTCSEHVLTDASSYATFSFYQEILHSDKQ
jgi:predicted transcriptional regulator